MLLLFNQITINQITIHQIARQFQSTTFVFLTNDPDFKRDSEFLDEMQQIMTSGNTLELFILYLSQFRTIYQKAQRNVNRVSGTRKVKSRN